MQPEDPFRRPAWPSMYVTIYMMLRDAAMENGYCLALHGSLARDLDVVAIPWTDTAVSEHELVEAIRRRIEGFISPDPAHNPEQKPHNRKAWSIVLTGGALIDLSVMPVIRKSEKKHVASPDCWCEPEEDSPGLFVHRMVH